MVQEQKKTIHQRGTVLVVEDELFVRMMAVDALEDAGFATLEAEDAEQAIAQLESRPDIDLVFTDIKMPGALDGLGLAEQVRSRWPQVALILTSGHLYGADAMLPASVPFLQKPYRAMTLIAELDRLLA